MKRPPLSDADRLRACEKLTQALAVLESKSLGGCSTGWVEDRLAQIITFIAVSAPLPERAS
jgi:hypothetical protein